MWASSFDRLRMRLISRDGKGTHHADIAVREERVSGAPREDETAMQKRGLDLLLVADPANMCYLTGYNAWSFYTPQIVAVAPDRDEPVIVVRGMDVNGARETTWLKPENQIGFPDHYVQSTERHPMEYAAAQLKDRGLGKGRVGTENDAFFYAVQSHEALKTQPARCAVRGCEPAGQLGARRQVAAGDRVYRAGGKDHGQGDGELRSA
jgi:hypothetical protein